MLPQLPHRRRIDRIADFLPARRSRCDFKLIRYAAFCNHIPEDELGHGGATDIAVADEKYFYHILITPFLLCISSQMPNIAGFFGIFLFLCFRCIFSNLPVFSRAFPCNIGKSVGK